MRSSRLIFSILAPFLLTGCVGKTDPCAGINQQLNGRYECVAIAIGDGNAWFTVQIGDAPCAVGVSGDFYFHQQIREVSEQSEFQYELFSPVHLEMVGEVYVKDNIPLFDGDEKTQSHWFRVEGPGHVSNEVTKKQWEQAFERHFGMTIEAREQWVQDRAANSD